MRKLLLILFLLNSILVLHSQDFFGGNFNREKKYIILTNPTVGNLEIIKFLINKKLLDLDTMKVNFIGIYHRGQAYDFTKSSSFLEKNNSGIFFLHEVKGELTEQTIFRENTLTDDLKKAFHNSIGIFFFGGPDIPPSVYGEENLYSEVTDPGRHYFELSFLYHLLGGSRNISFKPFLDEKPDYLVTGFCLGMQTMNVATGGSLYQDIPAQLYNKKNTEEILDIDRANLHRNYWQILNNDKQLMGINLHSVRFTSHPFFGKTIRMSKSKMPTIYSSHHQAAKDIGSGLEVTALSPDDKVVEGLAHKKFPHVFSVQFHPEVPALYENRELWKFSPDDTPKSFHSLLDRKSLRFHEKYWKNISGIIGSLNNSDEE